MAKIDRFENYFEPQIRVRGAEYFNEGRVVAREVVPGKEAAFDVSGTSLYRVEVVLDEDTHEFDWNCSCQHFKDGNNCKHIWASLIAAERQGFFINLPVVSDLAEKRIELPQSDQIQDVALSPSQWRNLSQDEWQYEDAPIPKVVAWETLYVLDTVTQKSLNEYNDNDCYGSEPYWRLKFLTRQIYNNGTYSSFIFKNISRDEIKFYKSQEEKNILRTVFKQDGDYYSYGFPKDSIKLDSADQIAVLRLADSAEKLAVVEKKGDLRPLRFNKGSERSPVKLQISIKKKEARYEVTACLLSCKEALAIDGTIKFQNPYILIGEQLYFADMIDMDDLLKTFQKVGKIEFASHEIPTFLSSLYAKQHVPLLELPEELRYKVVQGVGKIRLVIDKVKDSDGILNADLNFKYGHDYIDVSEESQRLLDHDAKIIYERDLSGEMKFRQQLLSMMGRSRPNSDGFLFFPEGKLLELVSKAFQKKWEVIAYKKIVSQSKEYKIKASSGIDWFDLEVEMKFADGQILPLPDLLKSINSGKKLIHLADGSLGILNDEMIKRFSSLGLGAKVVGEKLRLSKVQAIFLSATLSEDKNFKSDKKFSTLKNVLKYKQRIKNVEPDKKFQGRLRGYQKQALSWLETMSREEIGCLLADDMGLGKTVCILALLSKKLEGKALIVVPKSLVYNWVEEAEKFVPHLKIHTHVGGSRHDAKKQFDDADIVITTYHTLRGDIEKLKDFGFEYLILDEAQAIKNPNSDVHKSSRLIDARRKIALTGTPIENSMGDFFSILSTVAPGLMTKGGIEKYSNEDNPVVAAQIRRALDPFFLRRKKESVLKDLPKKTEQVRYCELTPAERREYDHLKKFLWAKLKGKIRTQGMNKIGSDILTYLLRLRQASCHQGLLKPKYRKMPSSKFTFLMEELETVVSEKGQKVLIFSSFVKVLQLLKPHLDKAKIKYEYMDGSSSNRMQIVKKFQEDNGTQVFLMTLKTGGVGLNLTAANYLFILDPWWNPAAESQAIDRSHRIGQKKRVNAYKIVARDTVEEKILALQAKKRAIFDAIFGGSKNISALKNITPAELELLFS
jgi:SNF2 family DNA or RNA helicase